MRSQLCEIFTTPALLFGTGGVLFLLALVVYVFLKREPFEAHQYRAFRLLLAVTGATFGAISIWRIIFEVATPRTIPDEFVPELVGYVIFWLLAPPMWFFLEYYAVESGKIRGIPNTTDDLKRMKDYSDLASKIWAGIIAVLAALIALKR